MATTDYAAGTVVTKEWLNDVDDLVYEGPDADTLSISGGGSSTSNIDPTYPKEFDTALESIRQNLAHAKIEIEELIAAIQQFYPGGAIETTLLNFKGTVEDQSRIIDLTSSAVLASTLTGTHLGINIGFDEEPAGASLSTFHGIANDVRADNSAANITTWNSYYGRVRSGSTYTGNITTVNGIIIDTPSWSGTGKTTNYNGVKISEPGTTAFSGAGTVTGFKSEVNSGTNRYGVWCSGTAQNRFGGPIEFSGNQTLRDDVLSASILTITNSDTGSQIPLNWNPVVSPSGATLASYHGIGSYSQLSGSSTTITNYNSYYARCDSAVSYTGTINTYNGLFVDNMAGWASTSDFTNWYGVNVQNPDSAKVSGGIAAAFSGNVVSGTGRWNIYCPSNALNHLGGGLLIGGTTDNGVMLDVTGDSFRVSTSKTPASAGATGVQGQIAWDSSFIYVCTGTNTWKRAAISTW